MRYLRVKSDTEKKNYFEIDADLHKNPDGSTMTQIEIDQLNSVIPKDYLTEAFYTRQTKQLMMGFFGGLILGTTILAGVGIGYKHYAKK